MAQVKLPEFVDTPVDDIPKIVGRTNAAFLSHKTRTVEFRVRQLRKLYWGLDSHEAELREAVKRDLNKGFFDAMISEIDWVKNDIIFMTSNLEKWMKDEKVPDISFANRLVNPRIRKDPLGIVLVVGAFNFPFQLSLGPVIGAIAGGNTVVLKPSEQAPYCAAIMQKIMEETLDPDCFTCVQGAIPQMQALLAEKWDKIFFTGSVNTAKIVAKAAAVHLTPTVFELGGKNPAIVTKKADPYLTARRLLWGKTMNAGQVCISQNYTLVDREVLPILVEELKRAFKEFFPNGAKQSEDYAKIVTLRSFERLKGMLDQSSGKIVVGGEMDAEKLFIEPTVVVIPDVNDSLLKEESFGPLMPLLPIDSLDEAISIANSIHATPLGTYIFGDKKEAAKVLSETRSGGATVNDALFHAVIPTLEFGGVGDSGMGAYRGKSSFDTFVHRRAIAQTPKWMERFLAVRYPPYAGTNKYLEFSKMGKLKPNFDREGNEKRTVLWYMLTLGGKSLTRGVIRALVLAGIALGLKSILERRGYV